MLGTCSKPGHGLRDHLTKHHCCTDGETEAQEEGRDMLSSGSGTYFGERGIRDWISSSACQEGDLRQVTCLSGLWFSHVDVELIVRAVVGIRRGGVSAGVCTVPHVG